MAVCGRGAGSRGGETSGTIQGFSSPQANYGDSPYRIPQRLHTGAPDQPTLDPCGRGTVRGARSNCLPDPKSETCLATKLSGSNPFAGVIYVPSRRVD